MTGIELPVTPAGSEAESQFQPLIPTSAKNCVPCTTRKLIRRATVDAHAPSTRAIRGASGAPDTRGLTYGEAADGAMLTARVKLMPSYGNDRQEMFDLVDGGHACGLSGDCSVTVNTERRTNSFTGDHTVYVHDVRHVEVRGTCLCEKHSAATAHNEYLIEDPGNSSVGYVWWSASLVYRFGEARTTDHLGISHGINLLVAPDTEGVRWKAIEVAQVRTEPSYSTGKGVGRLAVGHTYDGGRTENGGKWTRSDGSYGHGWVHILFGGSWRWVKGVAVVLA